MRRDFPGLLEESGQYDLLVCGGGIYGAWVAYDAALRGLRVALVEQGDWAGATSSASSKLIHGGLRYLETYDFKLVGKALKERQSLLESAPHRVWPLRFGVPVYEDGRVGMLKLKAGLTLYDALAGFPGEEMRHRSYGQAAFSERFPFLNASHLKGGFTYGDAQTDDARLVLELVSGAMEAGAVCVNYCRLDRLIVEGGRACGAVLRSQRGDGEAEIRARQIVHVGGQWIAASEEGSGWCRLSKGVHLVMPALPTGEALLLTAKVDGRVFFAIPWYGRTLLGTTDTDYRGDTGRIAVEQEDVDYLLAAANPYLLKAWSAADVIGAYAGLRVMKRSDAEHPSSASRDWELKTAANGVHYSVGGKITSAREDAASIVDTVCKAIGVDASCVTGGRAFPWSADAVWMLEAAARAERLGIDRESTQWLLRRHGKRAGEVFAMIEQTPSMSARIVPDLPFIIADLMFCARDEMAIHLEDLLRRRMPLLILAKLGEGQLRHIAGMVAPVMGWDEATLNREVEVSKDSLH